MQLLYRMVIFPFSAAFLCVLSLASFLHSYQPSTYEGDSTQAESVMNSAGMLFALSVMAGVAFIEAKNGDAFKDYRGAEDAKAWYVPCFLGRCLLVSLLMQAGIAFSIGHLPYWVLALEVVYLLLLLCVRPYESVLNNVGALLC